MIITIEFCMMWNYAPRAVSLTEKLYAEYEHRITQINLISSRGGVFEVTVDGTLIYSKKVTQRHATFTEVRDAINQLKGT